MELTCMNSDDASSLFKRRGMSPSPWAGLVTWRRGVVEGVVVCRGSCEVDGGRGAVAVGDGRRRVLRMVGMVVVERQPLFVVDHAQIKHRQTPTFALGVAMRQQELAKFVGIFSKVI